MSIVETHPIHFIFRELQIPLFGLLNVEDMGVLILVDRHAREQIATVAQNMPLFRQICFNHYFYIIRGGLSSTEFDRRSEQEKYVLEDKVRRFMGPALSRLRPFALSQIIDISPDKKMQDFWNAMTYYMDEDTHLAGVLLNSKKGEAISENTVYMTLAEAIIKARATVIRDIQQFTRRVA